MNKLKDITSKININKVLPKEKVKLHTDIFDKFNQAFETKTCNEDIVEFELKPTELYYKLGGTLTKENVNKTNATVKYLKDNNMNDYDICMLILNIGIKSCLTPNDLPNTLWEDSLLKRDTYYYHNTLQLVSAAPIWDPETNSIKSEDLYVEMLIKYTIDDLYKYYINKLQLSNDFLQETRDKGALKHLLSIYTKIEDIESIDIVLMLIDEASEDDSVITNPLQLQNYESNVITRCHKFLPQAKFNKSNQIIWRKH